MAGETPSAGSGPGPSPAQQSPRDVVPAPRVQQVPIGTGEITGVVVAADTGRPVRNALVNLNGSTMRTEDLAGNRGTTTVVTGGILGPGSAPIVPGPGMGPGDGRGGGRSANLRATVVSRTAVSDAQGRFLFDRLPAGRFSLMVSRTSYLQANYGQKAPGRPGVPIQLKEGQRLNLQVPLIRGGVITGEVLGDDGEPAANARIQLYRVVRPDGTRRLQQTNSGTADDRGQYRLHGLQPGDYVIGATPNAVDYVNLDRSQTQRAAFDAAVAEAAARGPVPPVLTLPLPLQSQEGPAGFAPTYYPSTPAIGTAVSVTLRPGEERRGVDIQVQLVRAGHIRGTVVIPPDVTAPVQIGLQSDDNLMIGSMPSTRAQPDGSFRLMNVPPGRYTLLAQTVPGSVAPTFVSGVPTPPSPPSLDDAHRLWARAEVTVDGQTSTDVTLALQPGRVISGHVVFDAYTMPPSGARNATVTLTLPPGQVTYGPPPQARVAPDGRFTLTGVIPGRYLLRGTPGILRSAMHNGRDLLDVPLTIDGSEDIDNVVLMFTGRASTMQGRLTTASGDAGADYTVIVAADDPKYWTAGSRRIAISRPDSDGRFLFGNLPEGGYYLAAVTDVEPGAQFDPDFLRELSAAAVRVFVGEGAQVVQDLRVAQ
jgi:hypothetical protein